MFSLSAFQARNGSCHDNTTHLLLLYAYDFCFPFLMAAADSLFLEAWAYKVIVLYFFAYRGLQKVCC